MVSKRFNNSIIQGNITDNLELYRQNINNFLLTDKGSQPSRPDFGTSIRKMLQMGMNRAEPLIRAEIYNGLKKFFPELGKPTLIQIVHNTSDPTKLSFRIVYKNYDLEVITNGFRAS